MTSQFPPAPAVTAPLPVTFPSEDARALLALRRSAGSKTLTSPGPTGDALDELLRVAARVPDHRRLEPWRFIVFEGAARDAFGLEIERRFVATTPDAPQSQRAEERERLLRAPTVVAVISSPTLGHKTPVWEQELSTGAVCQTLLLAASAAGWGACWLTEWISFDDGIRDILGLSASERVAGFVYIGTSTTDAPERPRPDMATVVTHWSPDSA
ncbi:MAG: nitroreductase [Pseudomonadota bacterium]